MTEAPIVKEITFFRGLDDDFNRFQESVSSAVDHLARLAWKVLDDSTETPKKPTEIARIIFADPIVSDFLIRTSRLAVFSKELAKSFRRHLDTLAAIKQLKFFYNLPTVAVLQQLANIVTDTNAAEATKKWNKIIESIRQSRLGFKPVRILLQEINGPQCYEDNAEYLKDDEPHAVYPTSIYRASHSYVLAKPDASVVEGIMGLTLTTTIKIVNGLLRPDNHELKNIYQPFGRCLAVIDNKVEKLYGEAIQAYFDQHNIELNKLIFSGNETDKHISVVEKILVALKKKRASRNQPVLVMGGGVIADVTGFATALYHRNTPYVMVCTSVVTGIDAGPSPRRGCDGFGFKNLYGAYHPPVVTFTDRSFFKTLHRGWVRHGIAEIIKMAVIRDESLFRLVEQNSSALLWTKFGTEMAEYDGDHEAFGKLCDLVIGKSLEGYVRSEYGSLWETHQCRPHAYGHTWTPGYELPSGMLHGHAVSTGMGFGAYLSFCEGWTTKGELDRILTLLSDLELSLWHPIMEEADRLYSAQEKVIEKRGGNLAAPVPKGIGKCGYINHMPHDLLVTRLEEYHEICQGYPREGLGVEAHCKDVGLEDPATMGLVNQELPDDVNGYENGDHENKREKELSIKAHTSDSHSAVQNGCDNDFDTDDKGKPLSYFEWVDAVKKKRLKNIPSHVAFERADDTPKPPPFKSNELCYPGVDEYAIKMTEVPSSDLQKIALATEKKGMFTPCMVDPQLEAQFLKMMTQLANAKRVLDVGTFTGMSAMAFAEGLPADGEVVTIEFDPKIASVADKLFRSSSQAHKFSLKVGDAVSVMEELKAADEKFDIVFLDASKNQYISYYKLALGMLTPSGFIMADNSLCALLYDDDDSRRQALHDFSQMVKNDKRVEQLVVPFREGVSIIRPKTH